MMILKDTLQSHNIHTSFRILSPEMTLFWNHKDHTFVIYCSLTPSCTFHVTAKKKGKKFSLSYFCTRTNINFISLSITVTNFISSSSSFRTLSTTRAFSAKRLIGRSAKNFFPSIFDPYAVCILPAMLHSSSFFAALTSFCVQ